MMRPRCILIILPTFYILYTMSIYFWINVHRINDHLVRNQQNELANPSFYEIHEYKKEEHYLIHKYKKKNNKQERYTPSAKTEVLSRSPPRAGARHTNENPRSLQLWSGEAINRQKFTIPERVTEIKMIELVIAYCRENLTWIYKGVLEE